MSSILPETHTSCKLREKMISKTNLRVRRRRDSHSSINLGRRRRQSCESQGVQVGRDDLDWLHIECKRPFCYDFTQALPTVQEVNPTFLSAACLDLTPQALVTLFSLLVYELKSIALYRTMHVTAL